jgi:aspartate-semialdehyde dehydrogenase
MNKKIAVGVLGCTGVVGQKLIALLDGHPSFVVTDLVASENSSGMTYGERACWREVTDLSPNIRDLVIKRSYDELEAKILFSGLDASVAGDVEVWYAKKGHAVVSNSRNHRLDADVPLIIPEINPEHFALIKLQQQKYNSPGFIVTNPNCSITIAALALFPIHQSFGIDKIIVTTMQAVSGAGYPGVPSLDIFDNVIPHIKDEEEKMHSELLKIFGVYRGGQIAPADCKVSAMCNRVPVRHGHTMAISFSTKKAATANAIISLFSGVKSPQSLQSLQQHGLHLPSSPQTILQYFADPFRPQPLLDRDAGNGMTVSIGNLRPCQVLDWKMTVVGHNLVRGAAGAAILNAEYLLANGLVY